MPLVIGAVAVLAIGAIAFLIVGTSGEPEFEKPPVTGKTPDYILDQMSPEQRAAIEKQEREAGITNDQGAAEQPKQNPYGR